MPLQGNLSDFDLSYIIQIIAQEGKNGKLELSGESEKCTMVFKNGAIIFAQTSKESIDTFLYRYLKSVRKYSSTEIEELKMICKDSPSALSQELIRKQHITEKELNAISGYALEDIACSLFFIKKGEYTFIALDDINPYHISTISFSVDAITMEAARRMDEWKCMAAFLKPDTVCSHIQPFNSVMNKISPETVMENLSEYILGKIDNKKSCEEICKESFISTYRVYELLHGLVKEKQISVFAPDSGAAKKDQFKATFVFAKKSVLSAFSIIITLTGCFIIIALFNRVIQPLFFLKQDQKQEWLFHEIDYLQGQRKKISSELFFRAYYNKIPGSPKELSDSGIIFHRDFPALKDTPN